MKTWYVENMCDNYDVCDKHDNYMVLITGSRSLSYVGLYRGVRPTSY